MTRLFRIAAWLLLLAIVLLSVVPPGDRPVTPAPSAVEHLSIFVLTGLTFALGYSSRYLLLGFGLVAFAAAIELIQLAIPGRHSRISDFLVDALSAIVGLGFGFLISKRKLRRPS
jgi:VanZ family protein